MVCICFPHLRSSGCSGSSTPALGSSVDTAAGAGTGGEEQLDATIDFAEELAEEAERAALGRTVDFADLAAAAQADVAPGPQTQHSMAIPVGVSSDAAASCAIGEAGVPGDSPPMSAVVNTAAPLSLAGDPHADSQDVGQELPSCSMTNLR